MGVYVDSLMNHGWKLGKSCHMYADSEPELDRFAESIGLKKWMKQISRSGIIHYDLVESKRKKAIEKGAMELTGRQIIEYLKEKL